MGLLNQLLIQINQIMEMLEVKFPRNVLEDINNYAEAELYSEFKSIKNIINQYQNCTIKDLKKISRLYYTERMVMEYIDYGDNELLDASIELVRKAKEVVEVLRKLYV